MLSVKTLNIWHPYVWNLKNVTLNVDTAKRINLTNASYAPLPPLSEYSILIVHAPKDTKTPLTENVKPYPNTVAKNTVTITIV